jgi:hypothetical protein
LKLIGDGRSRLERGTVVVGVSAPCPVVGRCVTARCGRPRGQTTGPIPVAKPALRWSLLPGNRHSVTFDRSGTRTHSGPPAQGEVLSAVCGYKPPRMRDIEAIDAELRGAWLATLNGCSPSTVDIERAARRASGGPIRRWIRPRAQLSLVAVTPYTHAGHGWVRHGPNRAVVRVGLEIQRLLDVL